MSAPSFPFLFSQNFTDELDAVVEWLDENSSSSSSKFVAELEYVLKSKRGFLED